ncbi:alpha-mannosidase [Lacisediminihabitans sp.]|uniref:alpha-mannosidase n=1 Tax=Lacisediminihabitans sp. TaxID=2787631 RepID=UPI002F91FD3F
MHDNSRLVLARIARFVDERITPAIYPATRPIELTAWEVPDEPVPFAEAVGQRFEPFAVGRTWGKPWGTTWFHVAGEVPREWRGAGHTVELLVDLGFSGGQSGFQAEGLVYEPGGGIVKAIEPFNSYVPLAPTADGAIDLYVEAASNPDIGSNWGWKASPFGDKATAGTDPIYTLRRVDVALRDVTVWELDRDFWALRGLLAELPSDLPRAAEILRALERAVDAMDPDDVAGTAAAGRKALAGVLAQPAYASAHRVTAVGHAHIDSAWLWPTRETIRKCARTFSNVLQLMEVNDEIVFACSSAQQFAWMKEFYPELFERIRARVIEGRFVPVGGMWVESDTNLPGGEALARQFVAGKGFFLREFGVDPLEVWLPDSFGYSAALPQIASAAGSEYFLTQKISWNETNVMPHHTFDWEGIDGTRIFTHFPPVDTYNSVLSGQELATAQRQYAEKGAANSSLVPFGFGDGGGGPTREMLAAASRTASLEGSPTVRIASPRRFFDDARAEYPHPPVWTGELYLEFHRGTYTSQARTKQGNRRSEHLLREAELWATTAQVRAGVDYPYAELDSIWQTVLLLQFHDILPGSSIAWVHKQAEASYREVAGRLEAVIAASIDALSGTGGESVVFNASPFAVAGVPPLSAGVPMRAGEVTVSAVEGGALLENGLVRVSIDATGRVSSLADALGGREFVAPGQSLGELQLFRDTPNQWDAWDIDEHYRRHGQTLTDVTSFEITEEEGRAAVRVLREFGESSVMQDFGLAAGSTTLEITTTLDWHERQKLIKLAFPIDVRAERAASEIQFGHVYRPTHENTSWDVARFETSAHRWVHVGEPGVGVAVANDATYGHDITRQPREGGGTTTLVRQSLLRAPVFPDPEADQGTHVLRSSVTVGAEIIDAVREGYRINLPQRVLPGSGPVAPLVVVHNRAIVVEAIKLADDRSGDVIVRLYESTGVRSGGTIDFDGALDAATVRETDLLERELPARAVTSMSGGTVHLAVGPFQIVTLRVSRVQIVTLRVSRA